MLSQLKNRFKGSFRLDATILCQRRDRKFSISAEMQLSTTVCSIKHSSCERLSNLNLSNKVILALFDDIVMLYATTIYYPISDP